MTIKTNPDRDALLTDFGKATLFDRYLMPGEGFQDRFAAVARAYQDDDAHGQRVYDYISQHWFMPATPILSNGGTDRGLPISCFLNECDDTMGGIRDMWSENVDLASNGGGIGSYWGNVRSIGEKVGDRGKTSGVIPFMKVQDSMTLGVSQGCVDGDTEILTEVGWVKFSELSTKHGKVCQVNDDATSEFVDVLEYHSYPYAGDMHLYSNPGQTVSHLVTPNHRMVYEALSRIRVEGKKDRRWQGVLRERISENFNPHRDNRLYITAPSNKTGGKKLTCKQRLWVAYQADGTKNPSGNSTGEICGEVRYHFRFLKERKLVRLLEILDEIGYRYTFSKHADGTLNVAVMFPVGDLPPKSFDQWGIDYSSLTREWCADFINELTHWDGTIRVGQYENWSSAAYFSTHKENADCVCAIASVAGIKSFTRYSDRKGEGNRIPIYTVNFCLGRATVGGEEIRKESLDFVGTVYCVSVPSGRFLARRNGAVIVTGNSLRRGSSAAYLPVWHPEIEEFVHLRKPTGGDPNRRCLNLHHGVAIDDAFMEAVEAGNPYVLRSPHTHEIVKTVDARALWISILTARMEQGEAYLLFIDTVNRLRPDIYKKLGHIVKSSNLCAEIVLHTSPDKTAVCCLSSLNLETYDQWKDNPQFIEDVYRFLDNVLQDFIDRAPDTLWRAKYAAMRERSVGLGVMGWHSFLQARGIAFGSAAAKAWNRKIFRQIREEADVASVTLANEKGACPDGIEAGVHERFTHKMAVAPTASISIIAGCASPGIEPIAANVFLQKTLSGSFTVRNRHLEHVLEAYGKNDAKTWSSITTNKGSVQHLDFLTPSEREVFKTAIEIDQNWVIEHAADRTEFIDQGQSVNLFLPADIHKKDLHAIHFSAWKKGLKSLYYCRSLSLQRAENVSEAVGVAKDNVKPAYEVCEACQ